MAVTGISRDFTSNVSIVRMVSNDDLATVSASGYITDQTDNITALNSGTWEWLDSDIIAVYASDGHGLYQFENSDFTTLESLLTGGITLPVVSGDFAIFDGTAGDLQDLGYSPSDATKTKVVMANGAVVANRLAKFIDTAGTIDDGTSAATNLGDIYAGEAGTAGAFRSYGTSNVGGYLGLTGINNSGNFSVVISNVAHGQSTTYSIADIGASTGAIPTAPISFRIKSIAQAAVAGGLPAQTIVDPFCTVGSMVTASWNDTTNAVTIQTVSARNGNFIVTSSGDPGVSHLNYIITK